MARVNKTIDSNEADDHLGREERLRKDSVIQTERHTNKVRKKKGLPPRQLVDPVIGEGTTDDIQNNRTIVDREDTELVAGGQLIVGIRGYSAVVGRHLTGDELVAIHRRLRRERSRFRELNGVMVEVGETVPRFDATKKGKKQNKKTRNKETRDVPGILKSIMVRLMPTEAEGIGEANMNRHDVETAMDETVAAFEQATGCEVVTAVVHRMSVMDLHIHIQYTQVLQFIETSHMLGRRLKPWKQKASKTARESLLAEWVLNPSPAQIGAKKKRLIAEGLLSPPPEAVIEYRKIAGTRDLGDGAIMGYCFRQKLNLVRAAEEGGEKELAAKVARLNDEQRGRFTPIANRPDDELEAKYLDLWLERTWRRNVTSKLPEEYRDRLLVAGVEAAQNYANFGSSVVEDTHIKRRIKELDAKAKEIEAAKKDAEEATRLACEAKLAAENEYKHLAVEIRMSEERVSEQAERIAELAIELEGAREASLADRNRLAQVESKAGELERERTSLVDRLTTSESEMARMVEVLKPGESESPVAAAERVAAMAEAAPSEDEAKATQDQLDELNSQAGKLKAILRPSPGESLVEASERLVEVADLDSERKKAAGRAIPEDVQEAASLLLDRMEKSESKEKWDTGGSTATRAAAFIEWLENEPKHLMEKFRKLVSPLSDFISGYSQGRALLKFVGIGKIK